MLKKSKELFAAWNRNSLIYNHWKSNEHLMEGLDGDTDLDVLLSPSDKERGCVILNEIGFLKFHSQYGFRYPNVENWIGFDEESGRLLHVHLHYSLVTGHTGMKEYELPWADESLKTRVQDEATGVFIMNPNLELVSLYTRLILKAQRKWVRAARRGDYKIDNHFSVEIDYIKERVNWEEVAEIANRYFGEFGPEFVDIAKSEVLTSHLFLRLYSFVSKAMKKQSRYHGLSLTIRRAFFSLVVPLRSVLRKRCGWSLVTHKVYNPHRGLMIAFIGQDGSGKSTVTGEIKKWLTWKIEADRFYLGSGEHFNPIEKRLLKKIQGREGIIMRSYKKVLSFLYIKKIADNAYNNIKRAFKYRNNGGIALFDRFPQTEFANINDGAKIRASVMPKVKSRIGRWIVDCYAKKEERLLQKAVSYHPDVVFKLILSPEESIRRKPQENYETVKKKHEIIKQLKYSASSVYELDATMDYDEEIKMVKRIIWSHIQKL